MIPLRMISFLFSLFNLLVSMLLRAFGRGRKGEKGKGAKGAREADLLLRKVN